LLVAKAIEEGRPYAMAFVDVRMPPGMAGVETVQKIWAIDSEIQIVLCTAYSDASWDEMLEKIGGSDRMVILKKPFDAVEAFQLAHALTEKWWLHQESRRKMEDLESLVAGRTSELQQTNHTLQAEVSERQRAQAFLNSVVENLPVAVFIKEAGELRFVLWNKAGEKLTGIPHAEMLGRNDYDFFPKKDADRYVANDREAFERKGVLEIPEEVIQTRDHGARITHVRKVPIFDALGQPAYLLGISEDITERKRAEEALHQSENRFRLLVEESPDAIGIYQAGALVFLNSTGTRYLGAKTPAELLGRKSEGIIHPDDLAGANDRIRRRLAGEAGVYPAEVRYLRLDGTIVPVEVSAAPVTFNGKPAMQFIARDITERKRAEEALRESEERFAGAFQHAPIGVALVSPDGHWLQVNRVICELVGYSEAELLTRTFQDITHPDDLQGDLTNVRRLLAGEIPAYQMEKRYVHKGGHLVTVLLDVSLVRDGHGQPRYFISQIQDITARKEAENALRESNEKFHQLADNITDAFWIRSRDMKTLHYLSVGYEQIWGRPVGDLHANPHKWAEAILPEDRDRVSAIYATLMANEPQISVEYRITRPDASIRWVHARGFQVRDAAGNLVRLAGIVTDITERKQIEEELRNSRHFLQTTLDALSSHIAILDERGTILEVNRAWNQFAHANHFIGSNCGLGDNYLQLCDAATGDCALEAPAAAKGIRDVMAGERQEFQLEYPCHSPREQRWFLLRATRFAGEARVVVAHENITARRLAQLDLSKSEAMLRGVLDSSTDCVKILDMEGRLIWMNDGGQRTMEIDDFETVKSQVWIDLWPPDERAAALNALDLAKKNQTGYFTGFCPTAKGSPRWWEVVVTPMLNAAGIPEKLLSVSRDITERKRIEAQLFQSQKMETVGKLAGGIAHEFNSILTTIIGHSELMIEDLPAGNPLVNNATEISKAATRAATLTRQLLAYGRGQFLRPEALDLNQIIAAMKEVLGHLMGGEKVVVKFIPAPGLQMVKADSGQLEQIIMNMVMNASDAMPNGGKLTLETANVSFSEDTVDRYSELKPGNYVMLAISDTGTGMTERVKARAFEPFFTTKKVGQGTGLGLSTCYGIAKQSGGHISVDSEPGRGTTFKIYLPQVESQAKIPVQPLNSADLPRGTGTILLAEDDPALRDMAATLMRRLGYTVLTAAHGLDALSLIHGHIDLLLTDVVMPHMSGNELAERVRALFPHTRILLTSAYTENAIVLQGVLGKGVALLQKPFTPSELAHKLREVLNAKTPPK